MLFSLGKGFQAIDQPDGHAPGWSLFTHFRLETVVMRDWRLIF